MVCLQHVQNYSPTTLCFFFSYSPSVLGNKAARELLSPTALYHRHTEVAYQGRFLESCLQENLTSYRRRSESSRALDSRRVALCL